MLKKMPNFLDVLGLDDEPMGILFSDKEPEEGFSPSKNDLPTREREMKNEIDWQGIFDGFTCATGLIQKARKKKTSAFFSKDQFGCPGGAFWMGFMKPQTEMIIHYASSGIPGRVEGEGYCESPDALRTMYNYVDPEPLPSRYIIFKPIGQFREGEAADSVVFFARPDSLSGLHQLATFVTNDPEVVASPCAAACGSLVAWPRHYAAKGQTRAVIGGWDPSARKFLKPDELSFTVPFSMFKDMLDRFDASFLTKKDWSTIRKRTKN